jgi:hypothetical protein
MAKKVLILSLSHLYCIYFINYIIFLLVHQEEVFVENYEHDEEINPENFEYQSKKRDNNVWQEKLKRRFKETKDANITGCPNK